jgi:hypothetical protein
MYLQVCTPIIMFYIVQGNCKDYSALSRVNGANGALSIGPSVGYTLFFVFVNILLLFTGYASQWQAQLLCLGCARKKIKK